MRSYPLSPPLVAATRESGSPIAGSSFASSSERCRRSTPARTIAVVIPHDPASPSRTADCCSSRPASAASVLGSTAPGLYPAATIASHTRPERHAASPPPPRAPRSCRWSSPGRSSPHVASNGNNFFSRNRTTGRPQPTSWAGNRSPAKAPAPLHPEDHLTALRDPPSSIARRPHTVSNISPAAPTRFRSGKVACLQPDGASAPLSDGLTATASKAQRHLRLAPRPHLPFAPQPRAGSRTQIFGKYLHPVSAYPFLSSYPLPSETTAPPR